MRVIKSIVLLFLITLVVSCSTEGEELFTGDVYVTLVNKGLSNIQEGETTEINYEVVLSKSFDKDIKLVFDIENLAQYPNLVAPLTEVTIPKNKTKGVFKITGVAKPDVENILVEDINLKLILKSYLGITNKIDLDNEYFFTVKKEEGFETLTEAQRELIKAYKAKGFDLAKWIGKIPVSVKVTTAGGGYLTPFENAEEKLYEGITYITLSDNATVDKPLLKMVNNAFGLNEYLQWVFRGETIGNTEFWFTDDITHPNYDYMPPAVKAVLKALGDDKKGKWKNKEYSFNVVVDDIEVKADKTFDFVRENGAFDLYGDFLNPDRKRDFYAVDFQYEFELWDELVKLTENNQELKDHIAQGGSIHPNNYITYSIIDSDDWGESNWVAPTSSYSDTKMKFKFNSDHSNSGDYDIIEVVLTAK